MCDSLPTSEHGLDDNQSSSVDVAPWPELVSIVGLITTYWILEAWFLRVGRLSAESYEQPFLFIQLAKHVVQMSWWLQLFGTVLLCVLVVRYRDLAAEWRAFKHGRTLRWIVGITAGLLVWTLSTLEFNFYFGQGYYVDRALLLLLFAGVLYRPIFVLLLLPLSIAVIGQLDFPLHGFSWTVPLLSLRLLILFATTLVIQISTRKQMGRNFVFALCCLVAGHYFPSGVGKVQIGWLMHDHIYFLLPTSYANGWLAFLSPETINRLTSILASVSLPIKICCLALELGAIVCLYRRWMLRAYLAGWALMHFGIFAVSGICFLDWIVLDATLLVILWRRPELLPPRTFTKWHFAVAIVFIGASVLWARPVKLCWSDARATYTYRFEAVGESGKTYSLPPHFFDPNYYEFTLGSFGYLSQHRTLPVVWGATDRSTADRLAAALSVEEILSVEREIGTIRYREPKAERMKSFLRRFVNARAKPAPLASWAHALAPPPMLWTQSRPNAFTAQEPLERIDVFEVFSCYSEGHYQEIGKTLVLQVPLND